MTILSLKDRIVMYYFKRIFIITFLLVIEFVSLTNNLIFYPIYKSYGI